MKIKKNSSIKATTWMGKYKDVKGNWKKVYFDVGSEDFDEVEELFEESISEPYTTMRLLGRAPSESLLKRDGFSKIELCSDVRSCEGSGCDLAALRRKAMSKYYTSKSITSAEEPDEDELEELEQEFSSKDTAVNGPQGKLPAVFKMISIPDGALVLDYGGGKPEAEAVAQAYLDQFNATEAIYDPFNQTQDHNREVVKLCRSNGGADIAICSNVLNVIKEYEVRINVLKNIKKLVSPSGKVYITVYEGSGKGEGAATQKNQSYQNNRKTQGYLEEVQEVFPDATRKGKLIQATGSGSVESATTINGSSVSSLKDEVYNKAKEVMMSPDFGFPEEEVNDYLFVDVYQKDDATVVEVRADVSYDGLMMLMDSLNPIVAKYDPDAYFDAETAGIATAYLFNNSVTSATNSTGVMAGERDSSWGGYVSNGMYSLERGDEDGIYYVFSDDPFDDGNDEPVFYTSSLENIKVDYPKLYEAWVKKYPKSIKAGIYDVPERPLDPPDPPEYDQEDSYEDYIEVTVDDIVVVDEDGEWDFESDECKWADSDEKFHDWYDYENHIYMDDPSGVVEKVYELLEPYIPGDPGRYHITCDVSLTYEIDGIESQITDAWFDEDHGYDYDKEVYTDNAEAEYLPKKSSVANFKFDNI